MFGIEGYRAWANGIGDAVLEWAWNGEAGRATQVMYMLTPYDITLRLIVSSSHMTWAAVCVTIPSVLGASLRSCEENVTFFKFVHFFKYVPG